MFCSKEKLQCGGGLRSFQSQASKSYSVLSPLIRSPHLLCEVLQAPLISLQPPMWRSRRGAAEEPLGRHTCSHNTALRTDLIRWYAQHWFSAIKFWIGLKGIEARRQTGELMRKKKTEMGWRDNTRKWERCAWRCKIHDSLCLLSSAYPRGSDSSSQYWKVT